MLELNFKKEKANGLMLTFLFHLFKIFLCHHCFIIYSNVLQLRVAHPFPFVFISVFPLPLKDHLQTPVSDQRALLIRTEMVNCHFYSELPGN